MLRELMDSLARGRWGFEWRYWRRKTPWDTNITPPEVMAFVGEHPPGRALDLGCGTGTNAITLALHGWEVTAVDFAPRAIRAARRKARAAGVEIDFRVADVTDMRILSGPYDYALDIGCLLALKGEGRIKYASGLARLVGPAGWYMLYAWLPRHWRGASWGISPQEVESLMGSQFSKIRQVIGEERGHPSAWYWFQRR